MSGESLPKEALKAEQSRLIDMFADGSGLESQIHRVLDLCDGSKAFIDWINQRKWLSEKAKVKSDWELLDSYAIHGDKKYLQSGRQVMIDNPEIFAGYLVNQITTNCPPDELFDKYLRLQELNIGNLTGRKDLSHAIVNDMIVYLQEKWCKLAAPSVHAIGENIVNQLIQIPENLRFNSAYLSSMFKKWLIIEGLINQKSLDNQELVISGNVKSPSSIIKEVLLRRGDLLQEIQNQGADHISPGSYGKNKMQEVWKTIGALELLLNNPGKQEVAHKIMTEIEKAGRDLEHLIRCRVYCHNEEDLDQLVLHGLDKVGEYSPATRNQLGSRAMMKDFLAVDTPKGYYRKPTLARSSAKDSGMAINGRVVSPAYMSAFWVVNLGDNFGRGELVSPYHMYYLQYPARIKYLDTRWDLSRVKDGEAMDKVAGVSIETNMDYCEPWTDIHRKIWDQRASGLEPELSLTPYLRQFRQESLRISRKMNIPLTVIDWDKVLIPIEPIEVASELNE